MSFEGAFDIIEKWLSDVLKPLNFDIETKINGCLTNAVDKGYLPISLDNSEKEPKTLKTEKKCYTQHLVRIAIASTILIAFKVIL